MKMREFWIAWEDKFNPDNPLGRINNVLRMVCNYEFTPSIHVREVDPEWDTLVEEMVEVLRGYSLDGIAASKVLAKYNKLMDKK